MSEEIKIDKDVASTSKEDENSVATEDEQKDVTSNPDILVANTDTANYTENVESADKTSKNTAVSLDEMTENLSKKPKADETQAVIENAFDKREQTPEAKEIAENLLDIEEETKNSVEEISGTTSAVINENVLAAVSLDDDTTTFAPACTSVAAIDNQEKKVDACEPVKCSDSDSLTGEENSLKIDDAENKNAEHQFEDLPERKESTKIVQQESDDNFNLANKNDESVLPKKDDIFQSSTSNVMDVEENANISTNESEISKSKSLPINQSESSEINPESSEKSTEESSDKIVLSTDILNIENDKIGNSPIDAKSMEIESDDKYEEKLLEPNESASNKEISTTANSAEDDVIMLIDSSDDDGEKENSEECENVQKDVNVLKENNEPTNENTDDIAMQDTNVEDVSTQMDVDAESVDEASMINSNNENIASNKDSEINEEDSLLMKSTTDKPDSPKLIDDEITNSEDTAYKIFYNKECINYECPKKHKQYFRAPNFALSNYKISPKRNKSQYICADCYDQALEVYEAFCGTVIDKEPLLIKNIFSGRQEFVEIIGSSDEEESLSENEMDKELPEFSSNDLNLIANQLEVTMLEILNKVEAQNQLTWSKTLLSTRLQSLVEETKVHDTELRALQTKSNNIYESLYQSQKLKIVDLQPLNLNTGQPFAPSENIAQLKPVGEIVRPAIQLNGSYYAVKNKPLASWVPCKAIEQVDMATGSFKGLQHYKVKFLGSQYPMVKTVPVKHMAYIEPPSVRMTIGTRVIAYFDASSLMHGKEKGLVQSAFYPGIIAEPLKATNKYRYLIFYDDGYTQYVRHDDVRLVCHASDKVWEDVHPASRDFIEKYVTQYNINRPMVQTHKGQSMNTESNGAWLYARVVDIDCSLVKMQFEAPKAHTEWIYRGSLRLGPVFREYNKMQKDFIPHSRLPRRTEPFIRYTEDEEASSNQNQRPVAVETQQRAVARKSVSRQDTQQQQHQHQSQTTTTSSSAAAPMVRHLNNSTIYVEDETIPKGKVVYYTAKRNLPPKAYRRHICNRNCLFTIQHNLSAYSPLSKPLLSGWERLIMRQKIKKIVVYRAPCGKMLRNMQEIRDYLRATDNVLNVDNFDFTPETCCLAEYVIESAIIHKRDIANGQEKMAIPLVNYYDNTLPPECKYAAQRIPTEGVHLNLDEEFLVGCDCEDDCSDKSKCACWQLTLSGAKYGNPNTPPEEVGYQFKRLYEHVATGIYECNPRCKCKSSCLNRVVQHSLQMKLQVFKTNNRGWGLRCINDIPRGSFICIYAGYLLTESNANEGGVDAGDEYFAELDYIEVAEQVKEGYESEVEPPEPEEEEEEEELYQGDDDADFRPSKSFLQRSRNKGKPTRHNQGSNGDDDSQERQVINFNPNADLDETSQRESSIRKLFGKDEACYVMDAKTIGNLGRYFNHSCSPNLFVQNVFVDTHDLRFPWVAFFASTHIRAGTELTWNYNYEVGVVPGKVLYCQCGAPNCRQRLL